jgi:DNA-binding response OmpR family regulator
MMKLPERTQPLVLVVDDEQSVLDEVAAILSCTGLACQCCLTAESAMAAARDQRPDLVLADVNLRGASGVEMCQRMRENAVLAGVPVMFLSAAQTPDIIRRSDGSHGAYYLRKPFSPEVLVELVDRALDGARVLAVGNADPPELGNASIRSRH